MKAKKINSLRELRQEKERLTIRIKTSQAEFGNSLRETRKKLGPFLLYKFAIPAGAVGLATLGIKKMIAGNHHEPEIGTYAQQEQEDSGFSWSAMLIRFIPTALTFLQTYLKATSAPAEEAQAS